MKTIFSILALASFLFVSQSAFAQCGGSKATTSTEMSGGMESASAGSEADIVDLAVGTDILSTLVAAVKAGELVDVLKGDGPFTVFAPTNEAFASLPEGTLEYLLKPENKEKLVSVLTYHVVSGEVMSTDLKNGQKAATVQGDEIAVKIEGGKVMINDANVVSADIKAANGVVHVIDKVILPPMK